jgi:hypothetical protein
LPLSGQVTQETGAKDTPQGVFYECLFNMTGALAMVLMALGLVLAGYPTDSGGSGSGGEAILEVTHKNGFQGMLADGSLIEIEVADTTDGNRNFTLYVKGVKKGTGTLTINGGSITGITSCTDSSLTYSGGVCYRGVVIPLRPADGKVWVQLGGLYGCNNG